MLGSVASGSESDPELLSSSLMDPPIIYSSESSGRSTCLSIMVGPVTSEFMVRMRRTGRSALRCVALPRRCCTIWRRASCSACLCSLLLSCRLRLAPVGCGGDMIDADTPPAAVGNPPVPLEYPAEPINSESNASEPLLSPNVSSSRLSPAPALFGPPVTGLEPESELEPAPTMAESRAWVYVSGGFPRPRPRPRPRCCPMFNVFVPPCLRIEDVPGLSSGCDPPASPSWALASPSGS